MGASKPVHVIRLANRGTRRTSRSALSTKAAWGKEGSQPALLCSRCDHGGDRCMRQHIRRAENKLAICTLQVTLCERRDPSISETREATRASARGRTCARTLPPPQHTHTHTHTHTHNNNNNKNTHARTPRKKHAHHTKKHEHARTTIRTTTKTTSAHARARTHTHTHTHTHMTNRLFSGWVRSLDLFSAVLSSRSGRWGGGGGEGGCSYTVITKTTPALDGQR